MAEIMTCVATKLAECLWDPISRHASYVFCFNQFLRDVEKAKRELEVKLEDVNKRKEEADRKIEEIMPSVKKWLEEVNNILEEVRKQQQKLERGGNKCLNVSLRYSLARQMEEETKQMRELKGNSNNLEPFSQLIQLPGINTQFSSKEVMDFKSRKSTYNSLLETIKDDKNKMMGLYGMGGSGKTTMAIEVGKKVEQLKLFDKVVKVVVSRPLNVTKIQEEIKGQTGLKFEEKTKSLTAQRLLMGLRSMKVLIILDDVWNNLDLQEIGIPFHENCCVLLTTRLKDVCVSMCCERIFELSLLKQEEAWDLLKMRANIPIDSFNEFEDVGKKIIDQCKGLPIAVVTVGIALKGKGIAEWNSALRRLRHSLPLDIDEISRGPFACLKLSYDYLPCLAKQLFLMCSIFPEDHEIHMEDLIRFAKGTLKFEEGIARTMEDARDEILVSIHKLLDSCLLMHTNKQACVKMHDSVRDVALWITKKQHQAISVDRHEVSRTLVEDGTLEETKAISLWNLENNFKLSNQLNCPTLEILLLHPRWFVEDLRGIEALKVLALISFSFGWEIFYKANIEWSMAQSIVSSIMNLHTLCFRGIALGDISFLCQLIRLEILDLRGSKFDELPAGIVYLKKLKLLDVFGCEIKKSPLEVIGRCKQLEELYFWDSTSVITENFSLSSTLKRYAIYDRSDTIPSSGLPFLEYNDDYIEKAMRGLDIQGFEVSVLNSSMKDLILRANCLSLEKCRWDLCDINPKINHLWVSECPDKRFIVGDLSANIPQIRHMFSHLVTLRLERMNSLQQVFQDSPSIKYSLPMLQELRINECPKLITIFTSSLISHCPPPLVRLRIQNCIEMKSLIDEDEVAHADYPHENKSEAELEYVWKGPTQSLSFHRLESVHLQECPKLKNIFIIAVVTNFPELRTLEVYFCDEWEGILPKESIKNLSSSSSSNNVCFPKLQRIVIWKCGKVKKLLSYSLASHCPSLEELTIYGCYELERIVEEEAEASQSHKEEIFGGRFEPKLHSSHKKQEFSPPHENKSEGAFFMVTAKNLEQLQNHKALNVFLSLKDVTIGRSGRRNKGLFEVKVKAQEEEESLKLNSELNSELCSLNLQHMEVLEYIWKSPTQTVSLHKLENVELWSCSKLRNIITIAVVTSFPELRTLEVHNCEEWEGIFIEESLKNLSSSSSIACFPKLKRISIFQCHKVTKLFPYPLASHCPSLEEITIRDCCQLEGVVEAYEGEQVVGHYENLFPKLNDLNLQKLPKLREIYPGYEFNHLSNTITIEDCPNIYNIKLQHTATSSTSSGFGNVQTEGYN